MMKNLLRKIRSKLTAVIAVGVAICFGFAAISCGSELAVDYAIRIAKEEFGCKKILWVAGAGYVSELTKVYYYRTDGKRHLVAHDLVFEIIGNGQYVVGVDKNDRELFIAVPDQKFVEQSMRYSPRLIQWPFAYSFTEIANFAAEYGYEYADGIDGLKIDDYGNKLFRVEDIEEFIKDRLANYFEDADKKYDELDVKFMLTFLLKKEDGYLEYCITQEKR